MIRLDSNKIKVPLEAFNHIDFSKAEQPVQTVLKHQDNNLITDKTIITNIDNGYNYFEVNNIKNEVIIGTSAKLLKDGYSKGISINTFERFVDEINTPFMSIEPDVLLDNAEFLSIDVTDNLELSNYNKAVSSVIQIGNMNASYTIKPYNNNSKIGYQAKRNVKSYKERQIGYNKLKELDQHKNRSFNHAYQIHKQFTPNTLRVETNLTSLKRIRNTLKVINTKMSSVLNSTATVNYSIFERIMKSGRQMDLFNSYYDQMSWKKIVEDKGYQGILHSANGSPAMVEKFIKLKHPRSKGTGAYYQIKKFKRWYANYIKHDVKEVNKYVNEIYQLLKAS